MFDIESVSDRMSLILYIHRIKPLINLIFNIVKTLSDRYPTDDMVIQNSTMLQFVTGQTDLG